MDRRAGADYVLLPFALVALAVFAVVILPFWALGRGIAIVWPGVWRWTPMGDDASREAAKRMSVRGPSPSKNERQETR